MPRYRLWRFANSGSATYLANSLAMHILFLTDNFPPETNAPASRTYEHAKRWAMSGHRVTVVTGAPNFPSGKIHAGYRNALWNRKSVDGIDVIRVWTYITANEGFIKRTLDYLSFMVAATLASLFVKRPNPKGLILLS